MKLLIIKLILLKYLVNMIEIIIVLLEGLIISGEVRVRMGKREIKIVGMGVKNNQLIICLE